MIFERGTQSDIEMAEAVDRFGNGSLFLWWTEMHLI